MKGTLKSISRSGDGAAVLTVELRAAKPAEPLWSEDDQERADQIREHEAACAAAVARFEALVGARDLAWQQGDAELELDLGDEDDQEPDEDGTDEEPEA